jgi:hypothetical protein
VKRPLPDVTCLVLLVAEPAADPLLKSLSPEALSAWLAAVGDCDRYRTDILEPRRVQYASWDVIEEWERAALVVRLPFGNLRFLGRGRLWDTDRPSFQAA